MIQQAGRVTLHGGEQVEVEIIRAPEVAWRDRIVKLLAHKGVLWQWQNAEVLTAHTGIEASYYVLHRDGQPFANAMTALLDGVGIVGHVWTEREDRGKGAASLLMDIVMDNFRARGGQALFLNTGYGSTAARIYERLGFHRVEPFSTEMEYYRSAKRDFDQAYFAPGATQIEALAWRHWPASAALFVGDFPGLVRCAALGLTGRLISESPLLPLLADDLGTSASADHEERARVLVSEASGAVVGMALWSAHPFWPGWCLIDLFCHPDFWTRVDDLLGALPLPEAERLVAYADARDPRKPDVLRKHGFRQTAVLPRRVATSAAKREYLDVLVFEK